MALWLRLDVAHNLPPDVSRHLPFRNPLVPRSAVENSTRDCAEPAGRAITTVPGQDLVTEANTDVQTRDIQRGQTCDENYDPAVSCAHSDCVHRQEMAGKSIHSE
jgi:hypothetical protein